MQFQGNYLRHSRQASRDANQGTCADSIGVAVVESDVPLQDDEVRTCTSKLNCCMDLKATGLYHAVADPGKRKGGFQTIEREARGVNSTQTAQNLELRPLPVQ